MGYSPSGTDGSSIGPHGVTSPASKPAPAWVPHGFRASYGHPPAPVWGPTWAAGGYLLHHGPPWAAGL